MLPLEIWYAMFCVVAVIAIIYTIYKVIWYTVKMHSLYRKIKKLENNFMQVKFLRPFYQIIFGAKGNPDFIIRKKGVDYEVAVISSISTHSRWNFEKDCEDFFLEVRKYNNAFYNLYKNSANVPEHAKMYKRETRFSTHYLELSEPSDKYAKQIILVYPRPKLITYAHSKLDYLKPGDKILDHEIMYIENLLEMLQT